MQESKCELNRNINGFHCVAKCRFLIEISFFLLSANNSIGCYKKLFNALMVSSEKFKC